MPRVVAFLLLVLLAAAGRAQSGYAQFVADFQKAQQFKDDQLLDRSLRSHSRWAVEVYMALARDWRFGASEASQKARAQMDMLLASWGRVFKTSTLEKVERYFASVEDSVLKQIDKNQSAYEVGMRNMLEARDAKKRKDLEAAREVLWKLAETYEQVGHVVRAAECWESVAVALAALPDPSVEERRDAVFALERYKSLRESWEFTEEPQYKANIAWMKHIKDELEAAE
ncbi:MAG TPA: hypothetical protein VK081_14620, partial [Planctomycetota bacterium]|nr:hypothetical protein [Planctomycetota bacterium]